MELEFRLVANKQDVQACYPLMAELRMDMTERKFVQQVCQQQSQGYQLLMAYTVAKPLVLVGLAGFVLGQKLAWGKHIYIDDLVTKEQYRSLGVGKGLLDWLIKYAHTHDCESIHLDSGVQRFAAHKFYLCQGYHIASHHFVTKLSPPSKYSNV